MPLDDFDFDATSRFRREFGHVSSQKLQLISHKLERLQTYFAQF